MKVLRFWLKGSMSNGVTLQTDIRADGRVGGGGGYNNIPAFSSKSAGIKIMPMRLYAD